MRLFASILALTVAVAAHGFEPVPPKDTLFKPTFLTGRDSFTAGTAFVCEAPAGGGQLLLTAQHLLGPAGGFEKDLAWNEINRTVKLTVGLGFADTSVHVVSTSALEIPGARPLDKTSLDKDIAAFVLAPASNRPALKLAKYLPAVDERVWVYGRQAGSDKIEFLPAMVINATTNELDYAFEDKTVQLRGTSGAPVLNGAAEVVAINIGGNEHQGRLIGYGNPLPSILKNLALAAPKK